MAASILLIISSLVAIVLAIVKYKYTPETPQETVDAKDKEFTNALAHNDDNTITGMFNDVLPKGNDANTNSAK